MQADNTKKRKTKKIIFLSLSGFLLLFIIISLIAVKFIYDGQFPRYDRHDETITANLRYQDLEADYPRELVNFPSGENQLQGYLYEQDDASGLIVLAHGIGGGADSYLTQITWFLDQGWQVFAYDATGSFDSEGKTTRGFPQSLLDLDAALAYVESNASISELPVMLFGHSWGGYAVANILHFDHDIAGVVSVAGVSGAMDMIIEQGKNMMGPFIYTQYPFLWGYQRLLFGSAASLNAVDAINSNDVPVLIIHGSEDEMVSFDGSALIARRNEIDNPSAQFLIMDKPGQNGHNNLFRSSEAIHYIDEVNIEYRNIYDHYNQDIPYNIKQDFYAKIDRNLAQDLDSDLMSTIQNFYLDCLTD